MNQGTKVLFMYVVVESFQFWITHHLCGVHLIMYDIVNSNKLYIYIKKRIRVKLKSWSLFSCLLLLTRNKIKSLINGKQTKCPLFECQFSRRSAIHFFRLSSMMCCIIIL